MFAETVRTLFIYRTIVHFDTNENDLFTSTQKHAQLARSLSRIVVQSSTIMLAAGVNNTSTDVTHTYMYVYNCERLKVLFKVFNDAMVKYQ